MTKPTSLQKLTFILLSKLCLAKKKTTFQEREGLLDGHKRRKNKQYKNETIQ